MFALVGVDRDSFDRLDWLNEVHSRAQWAAQYRSRAVEAMVEARRAGATDEEIADACGLSVQAVDAYILGWNRRSQVTTRVGRPPQRRRRRGDVPR